MRSAETHEAGSLRGAITVGRADYANPGHAAALVRVLDAYARDPAGGGEGLSAYAQANVVRELAARPQAFSVLAWDGDTAVGLVNCIEGFSTFACKPLVNVHDVAVLASHRGHGIAARMLELAERIARERGAVNSPGAVGAQRRWGRRLGAVRTPNVMRRTNAVSAASRAPARRRCAKPSAPPR